MYLLFISERLATASSYKSMGRCYVQEKRIKSIENPKGFTRVSSEVQVRPVLYVNWHS